jgi:4-amino-4-deoxy-L-arabinose transferase-like glycosyltransferase
VVPVWPYFGWIGLGGVALCLLQARTPARPGDWRDRMANLDSMAVPGWRMWIAWLISLALVVAGFEGVFHQRGGWEVEYLTAGLVLLAGGSLQAPKPGTLHIRRWTVFAAALVLAVLFLLRLYRLETIPPNLHHDMAQWTVQAFRFMDGDVRTPFTNGWAEVPMIGYLWTGFVSVLGGRSLAAARFPSVLGSLIAIVTVFALVRRMFDTPTAVVAVILLGFDQTFLHFSRIQAYMDPVPFHVLAVLGLVAGLQTGRYEWFALAGLAGGYSSLTDHAGRITPPALLRLGALILLRYPRTIL